MRDTAATPASSGSGKTDSDQMKDTDEIKNPGSSFQIRRLFPVFFVVVIDLMGFGIVLPLLPFYASEFGVGAVQIGLLYSVFSLMQLIFSPIWGGLSDRIGRRPVMLLSTFGASVSYVIFAFAGSFWILMGSRILAGLMGGNISTAQAYIADVTDRENRARGMGLIGAAFGIGFVIGPALATLFLQPFVVDAVQVVGSPEAAAWISEHPFVIPGLAASVMSFSSFLFVWAKLPETVNVERSGTDAQGAKPTAQERRHSLFSPTFWRQLRERTALDSKGPSRGILLPLFAAFFLLSFGEASLYSAFPLFAEENIGMNAAQVGVQFFYIGLVAVFIQGFLIRPLTRRFGEESVFMAGNVFMVLGLAGIAFSASLTSLSLTIGLLAIGKSLNTPTITSLISQESDEEHYGATMGMAQGFSGLGRMVGPTWGGALYAVSIGLPFLATAAILSSVIFIGFWILRKTRVQPA